MLLFHEKAFGMKKEHAAPYKGAVALDGFIIRGALRRCQDSPPAGKPAGGIFV